jgi:D-cysteine desulfhydrase
MAHPAIPRVELAQAPTPLLKLERLSARLGVELWVKRDDLTGLLESGNKVRKLEFLVGAALAEGADTLVTCGTVQSNCCRTVAAVSARLGLRAVLALKGERPHTYDGNLLLDRILGAEVHYVSDEQWGKVDDILADLEGRVRAHGGRPYVIPESGATVVGALGYVTCAREIAQQIRHGAPEFDTIVITAFSGGSHAGLLMGKQLTGLRAEIVSVPVAWQAGEVRDYVSGVIEEARRRFGLDVAAPAEVGLIDGYQGAGRSEVREDDLRTVLRLAQQEGILLDPVYTAKAFRGLVDQLEQSPSVLGRRVCFIHTGGIFSLFPFKELFGRLVDHGFAPTEGPRA